MSLSEKMFSRANKSCPLRTDCRAEVNKRYIDDLFADDWEVFVIKRDERNEKFDWFTLCCDATVPTEYAQ